MAFEISLKNKVALVTGGSRGIGAEICRQLAIAGADIIINHSHSQKGREAAGKLVPELEGYGVRTMVAEYDVTSECEVKEMVERAVDKFSHIDILVNNAAMTIQQKFEETSYEDWKKVIDTNLNGTFLVTRHVIPVMLKSKDGSIVMITSTATINGGGGGASYPASKGGIEGLARQLVVEYAPLGIRTNIIRPAIIDTEMLRLRYHTDEEVAEHAKIIPVGRAGKPRDIANAVVFLSSDKASFICGASLFVDGGRSYYKR
jgi:Dehydrogenases with different specificities (related to short-chain alcohol dehydrogenases)